MFTYHHKKETRQRAWAQHSATFDLKDTGILQYIYIIYINQSQRSRNSCLLACELPDTKCAARSLCRGKTRFFAPRQCSFHSALCNGLHTRAPLSPPTCRTCPVHAVTVTFLTISRHLLDWSTAVRVTLARAHEDRFSIQWSSGANGHQYDNITVFNYERISSKVHPSHHILVLLFIPVTINQPSCFGNEHRHPGIKDCPATVPTTPAIP